LDQSSILFNLKREREIKLYGLSQEIENRQIQEKEKIKQMKEFLSILRNKIKEKDEQIEFIRRDIDKAIHVQEADCIKEVFITQPGRMNLEVNNELHYTNDVLNNFQKLYEIEKSNSKALDDEIEVFKIF
jgi:hypothetical protein